MIACMFLFLPHCALDIFANGKRVNNGGEFGLEILAIFHFYGPKKAIKMEWLANETVNYCLK